MTVDEIFWVQLELEAMLRDQVDQEIAFPLLAEEVPMVDHSGNAIMAPVVIFQELKGSKSRGGDITPNIFSLIHPLVQSRT